MLLQALTRREADVLEALLTGLSEKEVAKRLGIACNTVHGNVKRLHVKFQVESRAMLILAAIQESGWRESTPKDTKSKLDSSQPDS